MKIAIIGQMLNTNFASKISGGIQTVERLHIKLLRSLGHEVHFIASADSEEFTTEATIHRIPSKSQEACGVLTKAQKSALSKQSSLEIRDFITELQPALIINHSFSSSHVRLAAELSYNIPILNFVHNTPDTAMDIGVIAKVKHYREMTKRGGNLVCVSRYQRDLWRSALRKRIDSGSDSFAFLDVAEIDTIYDPVCHPVYVDKVECSAGNTDDVVVITRLDPIKNLHKLLELCLDKQVKQFNLKVFVAQPGDLADNEYYTDRIKPLLDRLKTEKNWNVPILQNQERGFVMSTLANAAACIIPCTVEAAPVVFLEAASRGVKSIVFCKEHDGKVQHAALDLLDKSWSEIVNLSDSSSAGQELNTLVQSLLTDSGNRKQLSDETFSKHSFECRKVELEQAIQNTVSRYTRQKPLLIEF